MTMKERLAAADRSLPPFQRQTGSPTPPPPPRLPWEPRRPISSTGGWCGVRVIGAQHGGRIICPSVSKQI